MSLLRPAIGVAVKSLLVAGGLSAAWAQAVETVPVTTQLLQRTARLPGEIQPYYRVPVQARVTGFVDAVEVDRASAVTKGQVLVRMSAPELAAQIAEAEARAAAADSQRVEAEAKLVAAQSSFERLKAAAATPGVVAAHDLTLAEKAADAARGVVAALEAAALAARAAVEPLRQLASYLEVRAPFDGVVTERNVHPGALAGPGLGPLLVVEQTSRLRLVVAVPEADVSGMVRGAALVFRVPAFPGQNFAATIARPAGSVDVKTRTMAVEADVANPRGRLAPGMYAEVEWPVRRSRTSLVVPVTAVAANTERSFVVRVREGRAEWVNVSRGVVLGEQVEVMGDLHAGDLVVKRATDEIRNGQPLSAKPAASPKIP